MASAMEISSKFENMGVETYGNFSERVHLHQYERDQLGHLHSLVCTGCAISLLTKLAKYGIKCKPYRISLFN